MKKILPLSVLLLTVLTCSLRYGGGKPDNVRSFYYWKTAFRADSMDIRLADSLNVQHFYLRYFDVDWSPTREQAIPVGDNEQQTYYYYNSGSYLPASTTPVVYITNKVFENTPSDKLADLAGKISRRVDKMSQRLSESYAYLQLNNVRTPSGDDWTRYYAYRDSLKTVYQALYINNIKDIQIDCDWTASTRDKYFEFLKLFKKLTPGYQVTCTVRLWQYKNTDLAGVPPVDGGMLMCYNFQNPADYKINNSIADIPTLKTYLGAKKYPLHLDLALPVFAWGVLFHNQACKGLVRNALEQDYIDNAKTFEPLDNHRYRFKRDTVIGDAYMRIGDEVRLETVSPSVLSDMANLLQRELQLDHSRIALFSWDAPQLKQYGVQRINQVYGVFE